MSSSLNLPGISANGICTVILTLAFQGGLGVVDVSKWSNNSQWSEWLQWTSCNSGLNDTMQRRSRNCVGGGCHGESEQIRLCPQFSTEKSSLSIKSQWGEWGEYGPCSVSCDGGFQTRTRLCYEKCPGCSCEGASTEQRYCNAEYCCEWTSWSMWSQCSVTCGEGGYRYRSRLCTCEQCPSGNATEQAHCTGSVPCKRASRKRICMFKLIRGGFPIKLC